MSMTKKEALQIIKKIRNIYNLEFDKPKLETWIEVLRENGDYEPTLKTLNNYINSGNSYPPNLPKIMRKAPKKMEYEEAPDDVKEHRWKMKNDPEYVAARKKILDDFAEQLRKFEVNNHE